MKQLIIQKFYFQIYHYKQFCIPTYTFKKITLLANNYSANAVTGVPKTVNVTIETTFKQYYYFNIILNATSKIALTDANDAYAKSISITQMKIVIRKML